jgi:hypothetical protein
MPIETKTEEKVRDYTVFLSRQPRTGNIETDALWMQANALTQIAGVLTEMLKIQKAKQ